jgi:hypothetical protein
MTEPRVEVAHRKHLSWLLAEAAQLEQMIMYQYRALGRGLHRQHHEPARPAATPHQAPAPQLCHIPGNRRALPQMAGVRTGTQRE